MQYEKYLEQLFQKMKKPNQSIYIQGNFDLNLLDYHTCQKVNKYLNLLFHQFLYQLLLNRLEYLKTTQLH